MFNNTYPLDHIIQTEWWSERITDGDMRGTRDYYIVLRHQKHDACDYVVHEGYYWSNDGTIEDGYVAGIYYNNYWDALEGFAKRAKLNGFTRAGSPHLPDLERDLDVAQGELHYQQEKTNI